MGRVAIRNVYVDFLLSTTDTITATDLSRALEGQYSHDQITRMLSSGEVDDKMLYSKGKNFIHKKGRKGSVTLSLDDSIQPKPYSDVNGLVGWHSDHTKGWCVKGINFVSALWSDEQASVPLSVQVVEKELSCNEKKQCEEWKAVKAKNEMFRQMACRLLRSREVDYVLADSWYASTENMLFVKNNCDTDFVMC